MRPQIKISPWFPVVLCLFYRLDPVGCFWPYLAASALHELGHCLGIFLCGGRIHRFCLGPCGAVLETGPLSYPREALCALAGPAAGFALLLFARLVPWLAFWGVVQALYNLLPIYPLDGGRALRCVLLCFLNPARTQAVTQCVTILLCAGLAFLALWITYTFHLGLWPFLILGALFCRVAACLLGEQPGSFAAFSHK